MRKCLSKLKDEFQGIKKAKKEAKKMPETIIKQCKYVLV